MKKMILLRPVQYKYLYVILLRLFRLVQYKDLSYVILPRQFRPVPYKYPSNVETLHLIGFHLYVPSKVLSFRDGKLRFNKCSLSVKLQFIN